jgi:hypothetical protein
MCTVVLPPGDYPVAVKYIILYHSLRSSKRAFPGKKVKEIPVQAQRIPVV